eukprot:6472255-Amphidinium_carterae.1
MAHACGGEVCSPTRERHHLARQLRQPWCPKFPSAPPSGGAVGLVGLGLTHRNGWQLNTVDLQFCAKHTTMKMQHVTSLYLCFENQAGNVISPPLLASPSL